MLDGLSCPLGAGSGCRQEARSGLPPGQLPFPELGGRRGCITLLSKSGFLPMQMSPRDPQSRVWPPHPASRTPQKSSCRQHNEGGGRDMDGQASAATSCAVMTRRGGSQDKGPPEPLPAPRVVQLLPEFIVSSPHGRSCVGGSRLSRGHPAARPGPGL